MKIKWALCSRPRLKCIFYLGTVKHVPFLLGYSCKNTKDIILKNIAFNDILQREPASFGV